MRKKLKQNLVNIFGFIIILIVTLFFISCIIYSDVKENFFSWFDKEKDIPIYSKLELQNNKILASNYQNPVKVNNTEYRPIVNDKHLRRGKMTPNILEESSSRDKEISSTSDVNTLQCKMTNQCDTDYYFTGAQFSGNLVSCQNNNFNSARAVASIKNGNIKNIHVIDGGQNYSEIPKISILGGNGLGAVGICILKDGKVDKIKLTNIGYNYTSTPKIVIEKPHSTCKLCCKK